MRRKTRDQGRGTKAKCDLPKYDANGLTIGELLRALVLGEIELPAWIEIGPNSYRITPESRELVCQGLQIALEIQTQNL